jgi:hypothetical protein
MPSKEKKAEHFKKYYDENKEELLEKQRQRRKEYSTKATEEQRKADAIAKSEQRHRRIAKQNRKALEELAERATIWKPFIKRLSECVEDATESQIQFLISLIENGAKPVTTKTETEAGAKEEDTVAHNYF